MFISLILYIFLITRLSSDLKLQHAKEIQTLKTRLKTADSFKCDLEIKLASVTSERDHLLGYTSAMKNETRLELFFRLWPSQIVSTLFYFTPMLAGKLIQN